MLQATAHERAFVGTIVTRLDGLGTIARIAINLSGSNTEEPFRVANPIGTGACLARHVTVNLTKTYGLSLRTTIATAAVIGKTHLVSVASTQLSLS